MMKGYVQRWELGKMPERVAKIDYWFTANPETAAVWETKEAPNDCTLFDNHRILIPSSQGGKYVCSGFQVEELACDKFLVFCLAPFIRDAKGEGTK
jgi:hypothetical protein